MLPLVIARGNRVSNPELIKQGVAKIVYGSHQAIVRLDYDKLPMSWVLTEYDFMIDDNKKKKSKLYNEPRCTIGTASPKATHVPRFSALKYMGAGLKSRNKAGQLGTVNASLCPHTTARAYAYSPL